MLMVDVPPRQAAKHAPHPAADGNERECREERAETIAGRERADPRRQVDRWSLPESET
jgi:hypothetical protein